LHTTEKFYEKLRDSRDPQKLVNSPMLVADNVGDILGEAVRRRIAMWIDLLCFF
jgi:hypothetical protein